MKDEFDKAVVYVNAMKDNVLITDAVKEDIYGLYKRITVGKCSEKGGTRPMFYNVLGQKKYDAWMKYEDISEEHCMIMYINLVNRYRI